MTSDMPYNYVAVSTATITSIRTIAALFVLELAKIVVCVRCMSMHGQDVNLG